MNIWVTSDIHELHSNVIKYCDRPFSSVQEMHERLVENFNSLVKPEDIVICLGDFSLSASALPLLKDYNGNWQIIAGNHDRVHPAHHKNKEQKKENAYKLYYESGFTSIKLEDTLQIGKHFVKLCHFPYSGDHTKYGERYPKYRPKDEGSWLLHGHMHSKPENRLRDKQLDCGVDAWNYKPVSMEEIESIINAAS